jgi:bifunctional non-homologous end joining protein LigD
VPLPKIINPMPLRRHPHAFDHPDWIFELKYDGFRTLAQFRGGECQLVSRNGNRFASFTPLADELASIVRVRTAVLDGEIVCVDQDGRPQFYDLLYRRRPPYFFAFDLLFHNGEDLRFLPLTERKDRLRALLRRSSGPMLAVDHVEETGTALFERVCALDLEGIVAKHRFGPYLSDREASTWLKIRNPHYSQWAGRHEAFERDRHREPVPGWHCCEVACALAAEQTGN